MALLAKQSQPFMTSSRTRCSKGGLRLSYSCDLRLSHCQEAVFCATDCRSTAETQGLTSETPLPLCAGVFWGFACELSTRTLGRLRG